MLRLWSGTEYQNRTDWSTQRGIFSLSSVSLQVRDTRTIFGNVWRLENVMCLFDAPSGVDAVVTWSDVYDLHGDHYQSLTNKTHSCYKQTWASPCTHISEEKWGPWGIQTAEDIWLFVRWVQLPNRWPVWPNNISDVVRK